jgi:hypothetical protein
LIRLRREADWIKTVFAHKKDILSVPALSKLCERRVEVSDAVEEVKASLAAGTKGHVEMKTAPLMFTDYVKEEEVPIMASTYCKLISSLLTESKVYLDDY